jgi:hypothetical protein
VTGYPLGIGQHPVRSATQPQRLDLEASKPRPFFLPALIEHVLRDEFLRGRVYHVGGLGRVTPPHAILETRRLELALDLPSLKVKDAAFGTALHEFAESYFPQYLAYR